MEQQKVAPEPPVPNTKPGDKGMRNLFKKLFRPRAANGVFVGRSRTRDISYQAQSPVGVIGAITKMVPAATISQNMNDLTSPVTSFGLACMITGTNTIRNIAASDGSATAVFGIAVKPNTFQASTATGYGAVPFSNLTTAPYGAGFAPLPVLKRGSMIVYCNTSQVATLTQQSPVFVWSATSTGAHVQGGFESAASASGAAVAGANTGTGTVSAVTVNPATGVNQVGVSTVAFTGATTFNVYDPTGRELKPGTTGTAYSDNGIGFTITTGGTAFVAGDTFAITITNQTIALGLPNTYFGGPGDASTGAVELNFNL
jgi:hypothetical protein